MYASLYQILTHGLQWDIPYYQKYAQEFGSPILELGAGLGRIALPLVAEGHQVHCLDISSEMCATLEHSKAHLPSSQQELLEITCGDMSDYALPASKFGLAIIALRSFQLLSLEQQEKCLVQTRSHLHDGAALVIHISSFNIAKADAVWRFATEHPTEDGTLHIDECLCHNATRNSFVLRHRITQYNAQSQWIGSWNTRHELYKVELQDLRQSLAEAGFSDMRVEELPSGDSLVIAIV